MRPVTELVMYEAGRLSRVEITLTARAQVLRALGVGRLVVRGIERSVLMRGITALMRQALSQHHPANMWLSLVKVFIAFVTYFGRDFVRVKKAGSVEIYDFQFRRM